MDFQDPYTYPGTYVLRNKEDIRDQVWLTEFEYGKAAKRSLELDSSPIKGKFDLKHLQAIHKHLFQDVYTWAGEIRTIDISKGNSFFASVNQIESYANFVVFKDIQKDNYLKEMPKDRFCERLTHHFSEINALHPFREGNGRSTREFIKQLAKEAGYEVDFEKVDRQRWNEAARDSYNGKLEPMQKVFTDIIRSSRTVAFEIDSPTEAVKKYPELAPAFALVHACETKAEADGLNPQQRAVVVARARQNVAEQIELGDVPQVAIREKHEVQAEPKRDLER